MGRTITSFSLRKMNTTDSRHTILTGSKKHYGALPGEDDDSEMPEMEED